ncbi:MAG: NPCBM/NEW2 domain-containing protein, partial [Rhodospirillales bacterium]|nr:NPCBM/NEW2 domain-containing protein [Rhodospirillales bacterium]
AAEDALAKRTDEFQQSQTQWAEDRARHKEEITRLQSLLRESEEARSDFVDHMQHHAIMLWEQTRSAVFDPAFREPAAADEGFDRERAEVLAEVIDQERVARLKREAAEALLREQKELEEHRRRASWTRMMGIGENKPVDVRKRFVIPTPVFYGGIAALLAVALWIGWSAVSSMNSDEPQDFTETELQPAVVERPVVARLIRTLDAVWAERHVEVRKGEKHEAAPLAGGAELREGDKYTLQQGFAQLDTKRGAIVVLEAPCEIELLGENQIKLTRGKLVGKCLTEKSKGFIVDAPTARIVDLGTEFGVAVDDHGATETVVFSGRVELREAASTNPQPHTLTLTKGWGGRVDRHGVLSDKAEPIEPVTTRFTRRVERRLNVADFVGGGDGHGNGQLFAAIQFTDGQLVARPAVGNKTNNGQFTSTPDLPMVDGVFIPDGGDGPVQVTSRGDVSADLRDTSGVAWLEISNGGFYGQSGAELKHPQLNGRDFGTAANPSINIHANAGITFDLDAVRAQHKGLSLKRFVALAGMSSNALTMTERKVDIVVLIDGRVAFRADQMILGDVRDVEVAIQPGDRFLTLVATDGADGIGGDWTLFGRPELVFEPEEGG